MENLNYLKQHAGFIDNQYLDMYIDLLNKNLYTQEQKYQTQKHHIIPVCYYKDKFNCKSRADALKYANEDPQNHLINLTFKDHILAHLYLSKCLKNINLQNQQLVTLFKIQNSKEWQDLKDKNDSIGLLSQLDLYQEFYQNSIKILSNHHTGKKMMHKDEHVIFAFTEEDVKKYLTDGWIIGSPQRVIISKDGQERNILKTQLTEYLAQGWVQGFSDVHKNKYDSKITIHKEDQEKHIQESDLSLYLEQGWELGRTEILSEHNRAAAKNLIYIYKGEEKKTISENQLDLYLQEGWSRGRNIKYVELYKENDFTRINQADTEKIQEYLNNGWKIGRPDYIGEKHSQSMKGKPAWNKGMRANKETIEKRKATIAQRKSKGKIYKTAEWTNEMKEKISKARTGKMYINKDGIIKSISKEDLDSYIASGWKVGRK